jgi:HD superfamily phosphohydrolase
VSGGAWTLPDPLYGAIRVSAWAAVLLQTPPFRRLAGVSLSDVPGELLFRRPFPSRLEHALGAYHLARLARPRDRVLHVAALAHDLGHGPFSHLTEPHMRERFGEDHEARSARLLGEVRDALSPANAGLLSWLDWSEAGRLVLGEAGSRGALLNGLLDYDNADNVARFLLASGLGMPSYDPGALACALQPLAAVVAGQEGTNVCLSAAAEADALGWRTDRARVYGYLHEGHRNLAAHSMLRKAVDMAAAANLLPDSFFNLTDTEALSMLGGAPDPNLAALVERVQQGDRHLYRCVWEAKAPEAAQAIAAAMASWRERLALEAGLAAQAGLAAHEVIVEVLASSAPRALPPICQRGEPLSLVQYPDPATPPQVIHLFVAASVGQEGACRVRMVAERRLGAMGAVPLPRGEAAGQR